MFIEIDSLSNFEYCIGCRSTFILTLIMCNKIRLLRTVNRLMFITHKPCVCMFA